MKRIAMCVLIALLAACGGGGGSNVPERTGIAESYYPVSIGSRWTYEISSSTAPGSYLDEMLITGTRLISGVTAWVFSESNPSGDGVPLESYYTKDARAFAFLSDSSASGWLGSVANSFDLMRFDGTFSASPLLSQINADLGEDLDGDGLNERVDVVLTGTVEGYETLVTNAGSFSNTARLRYDLSATLKLTTGATIPFTETIHEWRAPVLGPMRQTVQTNMLGATETFNLDLRGVSVNGVMAGMTAPRELLANLATADSDTTRPGQPAVASDGTRYLVVSNRQNGVTRQWVGQFVAADGQLQASIDISPATDLWGAPALAWNGANYLLVTGGSNAYGVRAQRISASGVLLDAYPGTDLAPDGYNRALAAGAGKWLAVYSRYPNQGMLYGRFMSDSGVPGDEFVIANGAVSYATPAVAFNGENFVVVWESAGGAVDPVAVNLYGMRISPFGTLVDGAPFAVSTAPEQQAWPQIACDTANCLVTWVDRRNYLGQSYNFSPGPGDMYGAFITRAGVVLNGNTSTGGIPIALGITANQGYPGLVFTGTDYIAAWSRGAYVNNPGGPTGIFAARISTAGSVSSTEPGMAVSYPPEAVTRYLYPSLAASSTGVLATWIKHAETVGTSKSLAGTLIWPRVVR